MNKFIKSPQLLLLIFSVFFAVIPFFWLRPGEMDLGGDSNRLYFYDPLSYIHHASSFIVDPSGLGPIDPTYYFLPYLLLLIAIKSVVHSSSILISLFDVFKLLGGFLAMYFVVFEILKISSKEENDKEKKISRYAALLGGLFYILSPIATGNWDKALTSHQQIFLNPLMFFLILRFFVSKNFRYAWVALFVSILFAPNFGFTSAPPIFAFYPLAFFFLFIFLYLQKIRLPSWKKASAFIILFLGLHTFQLVPQAISLLEPGSFSNTRVFDHKVIMNEGVQYFIAILPLAKVSNYLLLPFTKSLFHLFYAIVPFAIVIALIIKKKKQSVFLLTGCFFLVTLFLLSANITHIGVDFYKKLFYLPGFSMFRNFIGQWTMIYIFFYALFFGQAMKIFFNRFKKINYRFIVLGTGILFIFSSWGFISGESVTKGYVSNNVRIPIRMDPAYEAVLQRIKEFPDDNKILLLPYTDAFYQVLAGKDGGAYVGPTTISFLTGKKSFTGYQNMTAPFSERFFALARAKDYQGIRRLLAYLNIQYIFYNSDTRIYDSAFPSSPYTYTRESLPKTQKEYKEFVQHIAGNKIFEKGPYQLFSLKEEEYLPLFYVAKQIDGYRPVITNSVADESSFLNKNNDEIRTAYISEQDCKKFTQNNICQKTSHIPDISFEKINPAKYIVHVENADGPYLLTFLNAYHPNWKMYLAKNNNHQFRIDTSYFNKEIQEGGHHEDFFNSPFETVGLKQVAGLRHVTVNGYANAWYITPNDIGNKKNYELIIEMTEQRNFYFYLLISLFTFVSFLIFGIVLFFRSHIIGIIKK